MENPARGGAGFRGGRQFKDAPPNNPASDHRQPDLQRLSRNIAEVIDALYDVPRDRERRLDLIQHHVLHAMKIAQRRRP
jgi:hypothetical protein